MRKGFRVIFMLNIMVCFGVGISFRRAHEFPSSGGLRAFGFDTDRDGRQNLVFGAYPRPIQFWEHIDFDRYVLEDTTKWSVLYDVGYLDGDSLIDMVGSQCGGVYPLYVYESPNQSMNPISIVWGDSLFYGIRGGYITDLDQDGIKEILFRYSYLDQPPWYHNCVYENTGDNQYTLIWEDTIHCSAYYVNDDFDLDGRIEFATGYPYPGAYGRVSVWECIGDNNYQFAFHDTIFGGDNNYDIFSANDMDGNGKPEFLFTSLFLFSGTAHLFLYEAIGDNIYDYYLIDSITGLSMGVDHGRSICSDVDADGIEEIVWSSINQWHIYKAIGIHQYQRIYSSNWAGHQVTEMNVYDLNENGYPEIIESYQQNVIPFIHNTILWEIEGVRLHQPNGGEVLQPGQQYTITWEKFDPPGADSFALFFSSDSGRTYDTIVTSLTSDDTMYLWTVPNVVSDSCKIMIWAYGPPRPGQNTPRGTAWDFSDSVFAIGPVGIIADNRRQIKDYSLKIPQNPITSNNLRVRYSLPRPSEVKLIVYNALGQVEEMLVDESKEPGIHDIESNKSLPSGIYFIQLQTQDKTITKKIIKLR